MDARAFLAGSCTGGIMLGAALGLFVGQPEPKFNGVTADEALQRIAARNDIALREPVAVTDEGVVYGDADRARVLLARY